MTSIRSVHPFDQYVQRSDRSLRVAEAALLFARDHCPTLDVGRYLEQLDQLALRVDRWDAQTSKERVYALRTVLASEEGFRGNVLEYYDPRNSLLNEVLDRRTGIPITLSAIWLDICEQLRWPFVGVGLPGHYIIKHNSPGQEILIDPFSGGRSLSRNECARFAASLAGETLDLSDEDFQPCPKKIMLTRMLNNLLMIQTRGRQWAAAGRTLERLAALNPDSNEISRQLAFVQGRLAEQN